MSEEVPLPTESSEPTEHSKLVAQTLLKESDRGCAILCAELLADALERLLRSFFRQALEDVQASIDPLFRGYGPLSTFSARIQVAYALAILSKDDRESMEIIRRLRNDLAHEWGPIDVEHARCADPLALLIGRSPEMEQRSETLTHSCPAPAEIFGHRSTKEQLVTRLAFVLYVTKIIGRLDYYTEVAKKGGDIRQIVLRVEDNDTKS